MLYFWSDLDYCYILKDDNFRSMWTIFARSSDYVLWFYPILWLFWPLEFTICKKKRKDRESNRKSLNSEKEDYGSDEDYGSESD